MKIVRAYDEQGRLAEPWVGEGGVTATGLYPDAVTYLWTGSGWHRRTEVADGTTPPYGYAPGQEVEGGTVGYTPIAESTAVEAGLPSAEESPAPGTWLVLPDGTARPVSAAETIGPVETEADVEGRLTEALARGFRGIVLTGPAGQRAKVVG